MQHDPPPVQTIFESVYDQQTPRARIPTSYFIDNTFNINQWISLICSSKVIHCRAWPYLKNPPSTTSVQVEDLIWRPLNEQDRLELGDQPYVLKALPTKLPTLSKIRLSSDYIVDKVTQVYVSNALNQLYGAALCLGCHVKLTVQMQSVIVKVVECDGLGLVGPSTVIQVPFTNTLSDDASLDDHVEQLQNLTLDDDASASFQHVAPAGLQHVFQSLVDMVQYPLFYGPLLHKLHIQVPQGVLLHGPPGVGKTLIVSRLASFCKVKMVTIEGPELYRSSLGDSEKELEKKFNQAIQMAKTQSGCILFIDEIDSICPHRTQSNQESRISSQLLTLMDQVSLEMVPLVVIGATNRPHSIDPSARRPGRFEREIQVDVPTVESRRLILQQLLHKVELDSSVNFEYLADMTNGYVGADLSSLCREMALVALRRDPTSDSVKISKQDAMEAMRKITPSLKRQAGALSSSKVGSLTWDSIGGLESVKLKLKQMVEWPLKHASTFQRLGIDAPRGVLLYGPPGCSKTTLVKVIAAHSGLTFLSLSGASVYSAYLGESERTIRSTFMKARAAAPSVIFFDEMDAIVGKRDLSGGSSGGASVNERVLSTLLNEMDGIEKANGVLIVGATNRPDMIDAALLRPGRFDRIVYVPPPNEAARQEILRIHTRNMPLGQDVDLSLLATPQYTHLFTGADLEGLCREAGMACLRESLSSSCVHMHHFLKALESIRPTLTDSMLQHYETWNI